MHGAINKTLKITNHDSIEIILELKDHIIDQILRLELTIMTQKIRANANIILDMGKTLGNVLGHV